MKKLAVVASGWHFPYGFYEAMAYQEPAEGWEYDLFVVSHRDPSHAVEEKKFNVVDESTLRGRLDKRLYSRIASVEDITGLGWDYREYPNTIGDWGNSNQWLETHDPKGYDLFLFTHDDNLILSGYLLKDTVEDPGYEEWDVLTNSPGMPAGSLRGSFEFFKPRVLEKMGWRFDLSETTLTREGKTTTTGDLHELYDWNSTVYPLQRFLRENNYKVQSLSPCYRVSMYLIEGERGYISRTHGQNTVEEEQGLAMLKHHGVIA